MRVRFPPSAPRAKTMDHRADSFRYMMQVLEQEFSKRIPDEQTTLPVKRKLEASMVVDDYDLLDMSVSQREQFVRSAIARKLMALVHESRTIDLACDIDLDRRQETFTGSMYVFNEAQMRDFIREVEDAVKERLSQ